MSYAKTRSKLANLLIKAGYNVAKSLRAVKYPYLESLQLRHNLTFWDQFTQDIKQYEYKNKNLVNTPSEGFAYIKDTDYHILGKKNKTKAFLRIADFQITNWQYFYGHGTWWYSYKLKILAKYRHLYPKNEVIDVSDLVGEPQFGVAESAGDYGHQEGTIPMPLGGWLEVELPDEQ